MCVVWFSCCLWLFVVDSCLLFVDSCSLFVVGCLIVGLSGV